MIAEEHTMKLSARNQLSGTVKEITEGVVTAEVVIALDGGAEFVAVITLDSARRLGLAPGAPVTAIVKATDVMLATDG
jgi:molybdate transport system regulatory protein